jgi:E3 ubiquitin-protein ligase MYCBP2
MCVKNILIRRWSGARITFGFMQCALCKQMVEHAGLDDLLVPLRELYREVADKAKLRLEYDGVVPAITSPNRLVTIVNRLDLFWMRGSFG